jgi:O-antigen ligase
VTGCLSIVGLALVFSDTRSIWIASLIAGAWLLWCWDKRSVLAIPVLLLVGMVVVPGAVKQRAMSIVHPEKETDSNEHRIIVWRTGWEMIKAHPLVGVGPEQITKPAVFFQYMPRDIHLPLPSGYYGHLHNIYIHYAAECGLPAALALTAALFLALYDFMRAITLLPPGRSDRRFMLQTGVACVIGAMVSGVFEKNLGDTEVLTMFLVITSLAYLAAAGDSGPANKAPSPTLI